MNIIPLPHLMKMSRENNPLLRSVNDTFDNTFSILIPPVFGNLKCLKGVFELEGMR